VQNPEYVETVEEALRSEILNPEITKKKGYTYINPVIITLGNAIKRIDFFRRAKDYFLLEKEVLENLSKSKIHLILTKKIHYQIIF